MTLNTKPSCAGCSLCPGFLLLLPSAVPPCCFCPVSPGSMRGAAFRVPSRCSWGNMSPCHREPFLACGMGGKLAGKGLKFPLALMRRNFTLLTTGLGCAMQLLAALIHHFTGNFKAVLGGGVTGGRLPPTLGQDSLQAGVTPRTCNPNTFCYFDYFF